MTHIVKGSLKLEPGSSPTPAQGVMYFDSTDDKLKISNDGSSFQNITGLEEKEVLQLAKQEAELIKIISGQSSPINISLSGMLRDYFSDNNGFLNTVNLGNTTASYDGANKKYTRDSLDTEVHSIVLNGTDSTSGYTGFKITANMNCKLIAINKKSADQSPTGYLLNSSLGIIASVSFSGTKATFATPQNLTSGTTYYVVGGGSSRNCAAYTSGSLPQNTGAITWVTGYLGGFGEATSYSETVESLDLELEDTRIVEINIPSFSGTVIKTLLFSENLDRETGDDIKYKLIGADVSSDDNLTLNQFNNLVNVGGGQVSGGKIQIKLIPKATNPTLHKPAVRSFCFIALDNQGNIITIV